MIKKTMNALFIRTGIIIFLVSFHQLFSFAQCTSLLWSDEFNGTTLNSADWSTVVGGGGFGNNELQYYTNRSNNLSVANGLLTITALQENYGGQNYTSAKVWTTGKRYFTYGRFEARIKIPTTQGLWPAFWMMPQSSVYGGWPASGEIDIMENRGSNPYHILGTIHYGPDYTNHQSKGGDFFATSDLSADFHVYAVEWEPDTIKWFVDNTLFFKAKTSDLSPYAWPFDQDFYMILNVAVGGWFGGDPDGTTVFPQSMQVDYVRVYSTPNTLLINGKDKVLEGSTHTYYVSNGSADTYVWNVPAGATIQSGQGTNSISVLFGPTSGDITLNATKTGCSPLSFIQPVTVLANGCDLIFSDFESNKNITYTSSSGTAHNQSANNPSATGVNTSPKVTAYTRNNIQYDLLYYDVDIITNSTEYENGSSKLYMDVYTNAPIGSVINWQFENKVRVASAYPSGRRAVFVGTTTVQNQWERIPFTLSSTPDLGTSPTSIDQFTFLFRPNTYTSYNFYIDNLMRKNTAACTALGVNNAETAEVVISPNPAHNSVNVKVKSLYSNSTRFTLVDVLGTEVLNKTSSSSSSELNEELDLSALKPGIYVLYIRQGDNQFSSERIIVY
jgi:beta-glucanase (GH16 family)